MLKDVGPPVLADTDVLNPVVPVLGRQTAWVWCHSLGTVPLSGALLVQALVSVIRRLVLLCTLFWVKNTWRPPTSTRGPSLGLSQLSLLNALDLHGASRIRQTEEGVGPPSSSSTPPPQPLEPTNDQLALEFVSKMQQQEKMQKQLETPSTAGGGCGGQVA